MNCDDRCRDILDKSVTPLKDFAVIPLNRAVRMNINRTKNVTIITVTKVKALITPSKFRSFQSSAEGLVCLRVVGGVNII
jgi:hypothetical protein